eukprot:6132132-Pyramimonas_sp.AAC.2
MAPPPRMAGLNALPHCASPTARRAGPPSAANPRASSGKAPRRGPAATERREKRRPTWWPCRGAGTQPQNAAPLWPVRPNHPLARWAAQSTFVDRIAGASASDPTQLQSPSTHLEWSRHGHGRSEPALQIKPRGGGGAGTSGRPAAPNVRRPLTRALSAPKNWTSHRLLNCCRRFGDAQQVTRGARSFQVSPRPGRLTAKRRARPNLSPSWTKSRTRSSTTHSRKALPRHSRNPQPEVALGGTRNSSATTYNCNN